MALNIFKSKKKDDASPVMAASGAYAFRIHEPKNVGDPAPTAAATMNGWTQTAHIAGHLLGNIPLGTSSSKMGTSIPSIFARIFLFEGAFQTLRGCPMARLLQVNSFRNVWTS